MKKIVPLFTCEISFGQSFCDLIIDVNVTDLNLVIHLSNISIKSNSVGPWNMSHCGTFDLWIIILITVSLSSKTYNKALESKFFVLDGMWSMFVGLTFVCLIGMGLLMFGLTSVDGFPRDSLLDPTVLFDLEWHISKAKSQRVRAVGMDDAACWLGELGDVRDILDVLGVDHFVPIVLRVLMIEGRVNEEGDVLVISGRWSTFHPCVISDNRFFSEAQRWHCNPDDLSQTRGERSALWNKLYCTDMCCEWLSYLHIQSIFWNSFQEGEISVISQMM